MPDTNLYDYYQLGLAAAVGANAELAVNEGDVTDFLLAAGAAMADFCDQRRASDHLASSVDGSEDEDLTELADDHFNVDRQEATAASVTLSFTRPSAGGGEPAGTLTAGFEVSTQVDRVGNEVRFVTDLDVNFVLGGLGPVLVQATAIVKGPEGNVDSVGLVSRMIDTAFDSTIAVASTTVAAGGNLEETDAEVRVRIRNRPKSLSRATKSALQTGALEVAEVRVAAATEDTTTGNVTMAVSDGDGNSNAEMTNDVLLELEDWRAFGIPVAVTGGLRVLVDMNIVLTLVDGATAALVGLTAPVIAAVTGELAKLSQGDFFYDTQWKSAARNVAPELIKDVELSFYEVGGVAQSLTGDYLGTATNELLRAGTITVSVA